MHSSVTNDDVSAHHGESSIEAEGTKMTEQDIVSMHSAGNYLDFKEPNMVSSMQGKPTGDLISSIDTQPGGIEFRDPKAEQFKHVVDQKIKEFRTLKQLDLTLQKQTPRIQSRP